MSRKLRIIDYSNFADDWFEETSSKKVRQLSSFKQSTKVYPKLPQLAREKPFNKLEIFFWKKDKNWLFKTPTTFDRPHKKIYRKKEMKSLYLHLLVDTEYYNTPVTKIFHGDYNSEIEILTVQSKIWSLDETKTIYAHPDNPYSRHKIMTESNIIFQVLKDLGATIKPTEGTTPDIHLYVHLQAHFAVAEVMKIFQRDSEEFAAIHAAILRESTSKADKKPMLIQRKNLYFGKGKSRQDIKKTFFPLPNLVEINGQVVQTHIQFIDTVGMCGSAAASYEKQAGLANVKLEYKDSLSQSEKENMKLTYLIDKFDKYALGDLDGDKIIMGLDKNQRTIAKEITGEMPDPGYMNLTIGGTVAKLVESWLDLEFYAFVAKLPEKIKGKWREKLGKGDVSDKSLSRAIRREITKNTRAKEIRDIFSSQLASAAKVEGGRCVNVRPYDFHTKGTIYDIDIKGCYATSMSNLDYCFGLPFVYAQKKNDVPVTLKRFLKVLENELVPGTWQIRFSTTKKLTFDQDLIQSWLPPAKFLKLSEEEKDLENDDIYDFSKSGKSIIFKNEIHNGILTSDLLEIIEKVWRKSEREELFNNSAIVNTIIFLKSQRTENMSVLLEKSVDEKNEVDFKITPQGAIIKRSLKNLYWNSIPLEKIVGTLQKKRDEAKISHGIKSALQDFLKLNSNTLFGDLVSHYFEFGNVVAANNCTAKARAMAWLMEKALHSFQTITDGGAFDLNQIVIRHKEFQLSSQTLCELSEFKGKTHVHSKADIKMKFNNGLLWGNLASNKNWTLSYQDENPILSNGNQILTGWPEIQKFVDTKALEHCKRFYGPISCLDIFTFEGKYIFDSITTHGSSNYILQSKIPEKTVVKMRGYEAKRQHYNIIENENGLDVTPGPAPGVTFLKSLHNVKDVPIPRAVIKTAIITIGMYRTRYNTFFQHTNLVPGQDVLKLQIVRMLKPTMFRFSTLEHYKYLVKLTDKLYKKYGFSIELFFRTKDGVNYEKAVIEMGKLIYDNQRFKEIDELSKTRHINRTLDKYRNPEYDLKELAKKHIEAVYKSKKNPLESLAQDTSSI